MVFCLAGSDSFDMIEGHIYTSQLPIGPPDLISKLIGPRVFQDSAMIMFLSKGRFLKVEYIMIHSFNDR